DADLGHPVLPAPQCSLLSQQPGHLAHCEIFVIPRLPNGLLQPTEHSRGISYDDGAGWYIARNNTACTDYRFLSDSDVAQNHRSASDGRSSLYHDRTEFPIVWTLQ